MKPTCKVVTATGFYCGNTLPCPYHQSDDLDPKNLRSCSVTWSKIVGEQWELRRRGRLVHAGRIVGVRPTVLGNIGSDVMLEGMTEWVRFYEVGTA